MAQGEAQDEQPHRHQPAATAGSAQPRGVLQQADHHHQTKAPTTAQAAPSCLLPAAADDQPVQRHSALVRGPTRPDHPRRVVAARHADP